jgi:hypothetical protein
MFWHDFWYALIQLNLGNYLDAGAVFQKVNKRIQSGEFKNNNKDLTCYEHKSLKYYIEKCAVAN